MASSKENNFVGNLVIASVFTLLGAPATIWGAQRGFENNTIPLIFSIIGTFERVVVLLCFCYAAKDKVRLRKSKTRSALCFSTFPGFLIWSVLIFLFMKETISYSRYYAHIRGHPIPAERWAAAVGSACSWAIFAFNISLAISCCTREFKNQDPEQTEPDVVELPLQNQIHQPCCCNALPHQHLHLSVPLPQPSYDPVPKTTTDPPPSYQEAVATTSQTQPAAVNQFHAFPLDHTTTQSPEITYVGTSSFGAGTSSGTTWSSNNPYNTLARPTP